MPVDPKACVRISAFNWVPPFAQGYVRDLRVRWALEEAGIRYAVRKLDAAADRPADYFEEQPFGQVPSYRDGNISLFESGAIVLHIGRDHEVLLPPDEAARARATASSRSYDGVYDPPFEADVVGAGTRAAAPMAAPSLAAKNPVTLPKWFAAYSRVS